MKRDRIYRVFSCFIHGEKSALNYGVESHGSLELGEMKKQ